VQPFDTRPLLTAKVSVPPVRAGTTLRSRLHARLREGAQSRLTTVIAPAGWGKTTLLAAWARDPAEFRPVGWLSLDEADDEPVRFWTYLMSALAVVAPEPTRQPLAALAGQGLDPVDVALPALLNALADTEHQYALVLDDYHVLTSTRIHEKLEFLLAYLPPALQLVISARADPPLPLARLRARGELTEIRIADLRCTVEEAASLLGRSAALDRGVTAELVGRTEGWPAGLYLAALALREGGDLATVVGGEQRPIHDYFAGEVLAALDDPVRDLLMRCSVLERLSGPLCDAVLDTSGSAALLDGLERADLFVAAIDAERRWYRCHQLFREVLRRQLDTACPDAAAVLLGRAADWYLAGGQVEDAVRYRIAAGDEAGAFALLDGRWFLDHGAMTSLLHFGEQLTGRCAGDPQVSVWLAHAAGLSGDDKTTARWWLEAAEPLITDDAAAPPGWRSLRAFADVIWSAYLTPDDSAASLRYARRAVALEDDPANWGWTWARLVLAVAQRGTGQLEAAVTVLDDAWRAPGRRQLPTLLALQTAGELMLGLVAMGEHDRARRIGAEVAAAAMATERAWGPGAAAALARLRLAEARIILAEQGPAAALPALHRAARLAEDWGGPNITVLALTDKAAALWATGERAAARTELARARDSADTDPPRPYARAELAALEARIGRRAVSEARAHGRLAEDLTDREMAVLRALSGPLTAREIGAELYLSINTVKGYTKSLYRKLGVATRADAVARARGLGLI
jgi:ATP/maltotriose-dependent transcriptional regulator MalT